MSVYWLPNSLAEARPALDLSKFLDDFSEDGRWQNDSGDSSDLSGGISVSLDADQLHFSVDDDGHKMIAQISDGSSQPFQFEGSGGGATPAGTV